MIPSCDPTLFSMFQSGEAMAWLTVVVLGIIWLVIGEANHEDKTPKFKREYDPKNYNGRKDPPDMWKW